jgi:hypothetical protein
MVWMARKKGVVKAGFSVPIIVAAQSEAWTVCACPNTEIMGSNPTGGMCVPQPRSSADCIIRLGNWKRGQAQ